MFSKNLAVTMIVASALCFASLPAHAQTGVVVGGYSSQQVIDAEAPVAQTSSRTVISHPDFRLMGLALLWSQMAWMPASPIQVPSAFSMVAPGDRRWRLR